MEVLFFNLSLIFNSLSLHFGNRASLQPDFTFG
jgi:hypothetical protein